MRVIVINVLGHFLILGNVKYSLVYTKGRIITFFEFFGPYRLRVNCVGVFDVLTFDNSQNNNPLALMAQYQVSKSFYGRLKFILFLFF